MGLGLMNGYNLDKLGYDVSDAALYGFGAASLVSYLSTPFLPKPNFFNLPAKVNRHRLSFLGIALSGFMLMTGIGNKTERMLPGSDFARAVAATDQVVFSSYVNDVS